MVAAEENGHLTNSGREVGCLRGGGKGVGQEVSLLVIGVVLVGDFT